MDPEYGARYRELYERHWWWRAREAQVVALLRQLAPPAGFGRILDVGCGDGLSFDAFRRFGEVEGVETEAALVTDHGRSRGTIHVRPFDASFDPGHRFGLVTMLDVVEHLDDDTAALGHAVSLLAPGGVVVVTVPAFNLLWTVHDDYNHHRRRYTSALFLAAAKRAGVTVRSRRYLFPWLFPLKLVVRAREAVRSRKDKEAAPSMPEVPAALLNRFFYAVCRLEQATWGRLPWPFGTSVLAVIASRAGD